MHSPLLLLLAALPLAAAHGYLSSPSPRGANKASYQVDDLKSPNRRGLCRGEPAGELHPVTAGSALKLGLTITAPHVGPCRVSILDADLGNEQPFAEKMDCAAPGGPGFWTVKLPQGLVGHKVLRWTWEGQHVSPSEPYEQCVDLDFGGGATYTGDEDAVVTTAVASTPKAQTPAGKMAKTAKKAAAKTAKTANKARKPTAAAPKSYKSSGPGCTDGAYRCVAKGSAGFVQCANGQWNRLTCAAGTVCQPGAGNTITCGWA